jgi:RNA polymerase sigma-70 factor (ECF subfamily)
MPLDHNNSDTPAQTQDDVELMQKMSAGDDQALLEVYDRYSRLVYTLAFHVLRDAHAAEDISQEIFLQLWRDPAAYNPQRGRLGAWITVITRHRAIDHLRRQQKESRLPDGVLAIDRPGGPQFDHLPDIRKVRSIFNRLPPSQREVLELAYFGGLTHSEIVARTGEPLGTVKSRIRLAMQNLRRILLGDEKTRSENHRAL